MSREAMKLALEAWEAGDGIRLGQILSSALAAVPEAHKQPAQQECNHCGGTGDVSGEYPGVACPECSGSGVRAQPEFIKHEVENAYDWSEWVCPDPESYLMKCCDCGLVHEAQFRVAKYKPAPSDECEVVSDPDLQAQFRMRRSEQWSPADTAHRPGGLPMAEQPAQQQEPVAWAISFDGETPYTLWDGGDCALLDLEVQRHGGKTRKMPLYTSPPETAELLREIAELSANALDDYKMIQSLMAEREPEPVIDKSAAIRIATSLGWTPQRKPLTDEELKDALVSVDPETKRLPPGFRDFARAIEAAHGIAGEA